MSLIFPPKKYAFAESMSLTLLIDSKNRKRSITLRGAYDSLVKVGFYKLFQYYSNSLLLLLSLLVLEYC